MESKHAGYVQGWRRRMERGEEAAQRRGQAAAALLPGLVHTLVACYTARRVILIGSLARGEFSAGSDIDLVVEGVPPELFFRAGAVLERQAGDLHVDLIPLEGAGEELLEVIRREGRELHGGG